MLPHALLGVILALAIFFCSLWLLKGALAGLEPSVGPLLAPAGNPVKGALLGFLATALIQSSGTTDSIAVTMVATGALRVRHALAIILGANVGTTMTAQLVAFGLHELGLPLLAVGLVVQLVPHRAARSAGCALMGVGGLFYGLWALGRSLAHLSEALGLSLFVVSGQMSDLAAVTSSAALTAIVQSSSAVTRLLVGLADSGSIPVRAAIGGVLGSNVGTVTTTLLASLAGGVFSRRTALLDLCFNLAGVVIVFPLLRYAPSCMAALTALPGRQVAHAHTLFNLVTVALALPWVGVVGRLLDGRSPPDES